MATPLTLITLAIVAVIAGSIAGVVGFGSAVLLLPVCNSAFGALPSVSILTVAALIGNLSRVALWWKDVQWSVVWRYWLGGIPFAILGSLLLLKLDSKLLPATFGVFILVLIPIRRVLDGQKKKVALSHFPFIGAAMGLLSSIVSTTGPVNAPFFLSYGLTQGTYLSTEALSTAGIHLTKSIAYRKLETLTTERLLVGLGLGACLWLGATISKPLVTKLDKHKFLVVVEILLAVSAILMIGQALLIKP